MAAFEIGADLDFIHGEKGDVELARHRLDGGDPEAGMRRLDLLLAGDQRHIGRPDPGHHLVVDLAREQAQRQADDARGMAEHALDGEMSLAGIGRAEDGGNAGARGAAAGGMRLGIGHGHASSRFQTLHLQPAHAVQTASRSAVRRPERLTKCLTMRRFVSS
jgi:hypothetical protein